MLGSQPKLSSVVESSVSWDLFLGFHRQDFDLQKQSQWSLQRAAKIWGHHHWFLRIMTFGGDCRNFRSWLIPSRLSLSFLSGARGVMTPCSCRARCAKTTGDESDPDLSSECNLPSAHDQSEALHRSGYWHLISMKFLQSFLRRHFTAKPVLV